MFAIVTLYVCVLGTLRFSTSHFVFVITECNLPSVHDVNASIWCAENTPSTKVVDLIGCFSLLILNDLYAVRIFVDVRSVVVPDGQMPIVWNRIVILVQRLEPCLPLFRPASIEHEAKVAARHFVLVGADSISRYANVPVGVVVCVEDDGPTIIAANDVAAFRTDVHLAHHEVVRDETSI